jgi:hypothetical protein
MECLIFFFKNQKLKFSRPLNTSTDFQGNVVIGSNQGDQIGRIFNCFLQFFDK